ncbi:hypothetical protein N0V82_004866 [Gnomoniopsis sp. IMI 355080]|nr:hypothetical protein N0V82_004866 [Gnomoniopsis sp. IMI 355080]
MGDFYPNRDLAPRSTSSNPDGADGLPRSTGASEVNRTGNPKLSAETGSHPFRAAGGWLDGTSRGTILDHIRKTQADMQRTIVSTRESSSASTADSGEMPRSTAEVRRFPSKDRLEISQDIFVDRKIYGFRPVTSEKATGLGPMMPVSASAPSLAPKEVEAAAGRNGRDQEEVRNTNLDGESSGIPGDPLIKAASQTSGTSD